MKIKGYLAAALVLLCLCGCGSQTTDTNDTESQAAVSQLVSEAEAPSADEQTAQSDGTLKDVYVQIASQVELPDMIELNDKLLMRYYGISSDIVADFAGGVDAGGVGQDEIVLIKAADEANVSEIEQALQTRYDSKLAQQENYNADEAEKIRGCKVETKGLYVTLIISNDADQITEIVNKSIG